MATVSKGKVLGGTALGVLALAAALIRPWEGRELAPYRDIVGVLTVCYGSTADVERRRYTAAECEERLQSDMGRRLVGIMECVDARLPENQWAALLSWSYNVGTDAACRSTLVRKINAGAPPEVWCYELRRWVYAGGKRVQGLANRREAELKVCLGEA